jgi:predicted nucleotidyltransferase
MDEKKKPSDDLLWFLQERAKELNCLYEIEEILNKPDADIDEVCQSVVRAIPPGWQYSDNCMARITVEGRTYVSPNFMETPWVQSADIIVQGRRVGTVSIYYAREMPRADDGPFLKEETRLLDTIVDRMGHFIVYNLMKQVVHEYQTARRDLSEHKVEEWKIALNLLRRTDHDLFLNIARRMLNFLCWSGIKEADQFFQKPVIDLGSREEGGVGDDNRPYQKNVLVLSDGLSDEIFAMAGRHLTGEQMLSSIQRWLREERLGFLAQLVNQNLPLGRVVDAIRRYHHIVPEGIELPPATKRGVQVSLIRRFLSDQPQFIDNAIGFIEIDDFHDILDRILYSPESQGKLGGKSAGLFLAERVLEKSGKESPHLGNIKIPKTWYITSDGLLSFLTHNNLNEVVEQKYKDINQVRLEYPHIIQTFKNSNFSTEIIQGLSMVLDDFEQSPLIVRSSSLLEDRTGSSFSGKYKSLFIANQGSKQERLEALTDAIAEVYASVFGPDPISYRAERGLLDFAEEMGIMIEEVVGTRVGDYFIPSFAGVAFSRNEFRWSPRIKAADGLIRLVPGLGTRAVDRTGDDYPVLIAPGQPGLRVNVTLDEIVRYAPKRIDVINLKTNAFGTVEIKDLLKEAGSEIPGIEKIVSVFEGQQMRKPVGKNIDFDRDDAVVTFDGLISDTHFIDQVQGLLTLLEDKLAMPVDIEFASDGRDFYLLQCRPQSYMEGSRPAPIPKDIQKKRILFSANRYVSNGRVPDITHVVYVDPLSYDELSDLASLTEVGRAVGRLNKLLPRRKFILMGPGRWGSRGDIKLGVKVTYADINNTALLIEIARKKGNYLPDLSFGTHFFQDLVEAEIRYLPLYPDQQGTIFNEAFFRRADNILPDVLPEFRSVSNTIKLIEVPRAAGGLILRVLMNADLDQAIGFLTEPSVETRSSLASKDYGEKQSDNFWAWRLEMAEHIASQLDPERFGVMGFYVFGSTKNATAGPGSDIDILVHFQGTEDQHEELLLWLEGWSLALAEMNYLRTGYRTDGLLDIHVVTDEDIAQKTSYAAKIGAITDPARPLQMMKRHSFSE